MRLQKVLAHAGIASRRKAVQIIESGNVEVNGQVITQKGFPVNPSKDKIAVYGKPIKLRNNNIYILLNKPKNCISAVVDPRLRRTVIDLIGNIKDRVYPVGRLDKNTTGLLLLTNDGELAFRLTHPKFGIEKTYEATVKGVVNQKAIEKLRKGLFVDGKRTSPAKVIILHKDRKQSKVRIQICEGRKHQVRLMLLTVGHPVVDLKRVKFGNLSLGSSKPGQSRILSSGEVAELKRLVGL